MSLIDDFPAEGKAGCVGHRAVTLPCCGLWPMAALRGTGHKCSRNYGLKNKGKRKRMRDLLCSRAHSASNDEVPTDFRLLASSVVELLHLTLCCAPRSQLDQGLTVLNIRKDATSA